MVATDMQDNEEVRRQIDIPMDRDEWEEFDRATREAIKGRWVAQSIRDRLERERNR